MTQAVPAHAFPLQDRIRVLEEQRYAAMLAADIPALDVLLSDNLVYSHSNATVDDKASYLAKVKSGHFEYLEISHPEERMVVIGSTVLVLGRMSGRVRMNGQAERRLNNRTLTVWAEEDGRWRMAAFQPTPIPEG
ncbi:MAG: nuclear transport factor 2 family protein [Rhizobiales bacterium]|nr:nuclear transport factor 2 family protein [Hyphomicrobiales bacterium]